MPDDKNKNHVYKKENLDLFEPDDVGEDLEDVSGQVTFDFSEDDVEKMREKHLKEAEEKKKKGRLYADQDPAGTGDTTIYGIRNKRQTNKEIRRVMYVMIILFVGMIGYFTYFNLSGTRDIINNPYNSRLAKIAETVRRGSILSADGEVLAEEIEAEDGSSYRYYPYGCTFAHVIGTSAINKSGVELSSDYDLITSDIDVMKRILNEIRGDKHPGNQVVTTLNARLQQTAHDALGLKEGAVVAIEPSTGKVLAMVSKPDYDPNTLADNYQEIIEDPESKVLLNQSTQGRFTPGSIFKIVTTIAYLRSGGKANGYEYDCDGAISLLSDGGETSSIRCYDGEVHGSVDLKDSFAESCNASYANIGLNTGAANLKKTAEELMFNKKIPSAFSTAVSSFNLSSTDTEWMVGATAIGQGNTTITPLHAAILAAAVANDGVFMRPYVIDSVQGSTGKKLSENRPETGGQLFTRSEAALLQDYMKAVVTDGTGYNLSWKSYTCAGKTGTAEVSGRGNNAWFIGYAPAEDPQIAVCVLVEDAGTASSDTVPIAGEIFDAFFDQ